MSKWPVLILVRSLDHGGCERDAANIVTGLDRERFEPHIGVFHEGGFRTAEVERAGVPIVHLPVTSFTNSSALEGARKLAAYIRKHRIRIVHAFDVPMDIFATPVARLQRVPIVITAQLSFRSMYKPLEKTALRMMDWLSDSIVVNSRAVGKSLERQMGFPSKKVYLCYNGVNPEEFHPGPGIRIRELEAASLVVGALCVMRPEKRVDWIVRSFAEVQRTNPGMRLLLVGSGPEVPGLMSLAEGLGIRELCHFEPGKAKVADWLRAIDIYINSSSSESFPNGLLEAMACGCCAIGSSVGGIPELITHMENGLIFDSDKPDELTKMLQLAAGDRDLREKFRERAAATAREQFSIHIAVRRTQALYESLLEGRGIKTPATAC